MGSLWANLEHQKEETSESYWLTGELVSMALLKNRYYSRVDTIQRAMKYSRNFCSRRSYDALIAKHVAGDISAVSAVSNEFGMTRPDGESADFFSDDAMIVTMNMVVFRLSTDIDWDNVGPSIFREMQDGIASQSSNGCEFIMRQFEKNGTKLLDSQFIPGWPTERDYVCAKKPCLGNENSKFVSTLSDYPVIENDRRYFFLLQANLSGRPMVRTIFFLPRPEQGVLLLMEVSSIRMRYVNKRMSGPLMEQHAKTAKDLFLSWEEKSAVYSDLDEMKSLYLAAQPLSEDARNAVVIEKSNCTFFNECLTL